MATLKDIAREAGISISAASLAVRDHRAISDATKRKVRRAQEKFGYKLNFLQEHASPLEGEGHSLPAHNADIKDTLINAPDVHEGDKKSPER